MQAGDRVERERELRRAVLAGEEYAWRTLYDEAFAGVYAYVLWRCGGLRDRADEVTQDVWLTAVRRLRSFDPAAGSFASWLRGIAVNVLRNHFRREQRRANHSRPLEHEPLADEEPHQQAERVDYKDVTFDAILKDLSKKVEGLSFRGRFTYGNLGQGTINLRFEEALPVSAILQALSDEGYCSFYVREYGILAARRDDAMAPPGALTVEEFLRQKPAEEPRR
ncbi:MAG: RNA polymerase sigma factor [Gemmataceae bacterium]